eukprot:1192670-Prorocentrum_minimum.AAC.3
MVCDTAMGESLFLSSTEVDEEDVFDIVRSIIDPEFPQTLEELKVVNLEHIKVESKLRSIRVQFTPTVPHCSFATQIGLSLRYKLERELLLPYKVDIIVTPGTHLKEKELNRQLNDKERIAAALEVPEILAEMEKCTKTKDF